MKNKAFQERVRKLRQCKHMSLRDLAQILSVTKNCICMWENGTAVPQHNTLIALSKLFDVPIDYLLGNDSIGVQNTVNIELNLLQKKLEKLDRAQLQKADNVLRAVFGDSF